MHVYMHGWECFLADYELFDMPQPSTLSNILLINISTFN